MALIQVLALDTDAHRSERGLDGELQGPPQSATRWTEIASDHPEFFRVMGAGTNRVSLVSRHVLPKDAMDVRRPLAPEELAKLLTVTLDLHDRQLERSQRWRVFLPFLSPLPATIIAGLFTLFGFLMGKAG